MQPLGLAIGTVRSTDVGTLVPVEPEPAQVLEDALLGLARRPLGVGVLDAQHERAVLAVRASSQLKSAVRALPTCS